MTFKEIKELIALVNESEIQEFKLSTDEMDIRIRTSKYTQSTQIISSVPVPTVTTQMATAPQTSAASSSATVEKHIVEPAQEAAPPSTSHHKEIKSPMVGTFYRSPSPDKDPFVQVGDTIKKGDVLCIIEAMKLFNEIESEVSGKVIKILVNDASPVEYDQPLYLIEPNA